MKTRKLRIRKRSIGLALLMLIVGLGAKAWHDTMRDPVVERTVVTLSALPQGSQPITIALISDIHVSGPDMPPERLERIVGEINKLKPDLVAIAGDLVSEARAVTHIYTPEEIVTPLAGLSAPLGVVAVPGNHDHWYDMPGLAAELKKAGVILLTNEAARFGSLTIGGLDDDYTGRADIVETAEAMNATTGAQIILSHSPDPFPDLPDGIDLMLAGHTHCGQIGYPWGGAPAHSSKYGGRYGCGRFVEDGKTMVVGPGLGTSIIPVRLFTQPTIWLIEIRPPER